eukprot:PhF_6_TR37692/c0_g1_i1/m.56104/K05607/AUH; methylglutaconyl-CoA hydratase
MLRCTLLKRVAPTAEFNFTITNDGIGILHLQRHSRKNALGRSLVSELQKVVATSRENAQLRAFILTSDVEGVFCAGADLKERKEMAPAEVPIFVSSLRKLFSDFESLPMPTLAAIEGAALGGGLELALGLDIRILGDRATVGLPETKLAIIPGAGGTQRLTRLVGYPTACELIFTGRALKGEEAHRLGLAQEVVPAGEALKRALEIAGTISKNGPIAVRAAKTAMKAAVAHPDNVEFGMEQERKAYDVVIPTADRLEGLAAFAEKRPPKYQGK